MSDDSLTLIQHHLANSIADKIRGFSASSNISSKLSILANTVINKAPENPLEVNLQLYNQLEPSNEPPSPGFEFLSKYLRSYVAGNVITQLYHKSDFGIEEFSESMKMLDNFSDSRQVDHYDILSRLVSKLMLGVYQLTELHDLEHWLQQLEDLRFYGFIGSFIDDLQRTLMQKVFEISVGEVGRSAESRLECVNVLQRFKRFVVIAEAVQDLQVLLLNSIISPNQNSPTVSHSAIACIRAIGLDSEFENQFAAVSFSADLEDPEGQEGQQDSEEDLTPEGGLDEAADFVTQTAAPESFSLIKSHKDFKVIDTLMVKGRDDEICVRILKVKLRRFLVENTDIVCIKTFTTPNFALIRQAQEEAKSIERALGLPTDHICKAYDAYLEHLPNEGLYCFGIVMEWFAEGDLETEIKQRAGQIKPWQEYELLQVFGDLISALDVLEAHKICHSDIKPHNIFKAADLVYKIGDFGVAKEQIYSAVTATQTIAGTDVYFSPQCAVAYDSRNSHAKIRARYDIFKSDVFSLGLTFLRMCLISVLSKGSSVFESNKKISISGFNRMNQTGIDAKVDQINYSDFLKHLIKEMLQVDERRRPRFSELLQLITENSESFCTIEGGKIGALL
jgi:serine/threonine protein kinase